MSIEILSMYRGSVWGVASVTALILGQVIVATATARAAGQTPGIAPTAGPESLAFRAHRAHQNSLENIGPYLGAVVAAIAAGAAPGVINGAALLFVAARVVHAVAYYGGVAGVRTAAFVVGLVAMLVITGATFVALAGG